MLTPEPKRTRRRTVAAWATLVSAFVTSIAEAVVIGEPFIDLIGKLLW
jgi:hypothetical protein